MAGERVLVVDDYEDSRELYGQYLRLRGYDVETAADGDAALRCALRQECDIVVLDLALPKFDGLTVLRLLRSQLSQREIAAELHLSFNTIKTHTRNIYRKLDVAERAQAVGRARELSLI